MARWSEAMTKRTWSVVALALLATGAVAQDGTPAEPPSKLHQSLQTGGRIAAQPVHDVDASRTKIPPVLEAANGDPYSLIGARNCAQIGRSIAALTDALGPDFASGPAKKENKAGKLAEAGGKSIVNAIIPFRGLVREISGAAPAQRRLNDAVDAGLARRGFLRGLQSARRCKG
jgi:hypothetical protein